MTQKNDTKNKYKIWRFKYYQGKTSDTQLPPIHPWKQINQFHKIGNWKLKVKSLAFMKVTGNDQNFTSRILHFLWFQVNFW